MENQEGPHNLNRQQHNNPPQNGRTSPVGAAFPNVNFEAYLDSLEDPSANGSYNWQSTRPSIKERIAFLFNNETLSDIYFILGKGTAVQRRIPAHKFVLSISSVVFDAMFNGGFASKTSNEIEIPDIEPASFLLLLKFLYTDDITICPDTVMSTLYAAKKYAVPILEQKSVEYLKSKLGPDNALTLLSQARLFDEPQLAEMCLNCIDKYTVASLNAEGFTDIDADTLKIVLLRDSLSARENQIFDAVVRWSEVECRRRNIEKTNENKRIALGDLLYLIRFPLMTLEEFANNAAQSGMLTDKEIVDLFLHFTVNPKPNVKFPDRPRRCLTGKEKSVIRFAKTEARWGYSGTSDRIKFMVNRRIYVVGLGLYGSINVPTDYDVNIQIINSETTAVVGYTDTKFSCDGTDSLNRVMFKEPIEILPNISYTACGTLRGLDSYYGSKGMKKVIIELPNHEKVEFKFSYAAGNNNGTSVQDGQIPEIIFYT
ncbi:BTB/POZ domain-containing protein 2 [Hydra vulgaris]|uniref:BTB/POZ domain-containing protein 2 n=1 Tax=Hydra vulgaris TaxID=6087 RepID=A0ABM4DDY9_HYDVU